MTMLIDEQLQPSNQGPAGWTPTPQPTVQFPGFASVPQPSPYSAFHYAPVGSGAPGPVPQVEYAPPNASTRGPVAPSVPSQGFSAKLTPTSMLLIVLLAIGGWYYYQHHQKPTPARPAVTQPSGPSSGQGTGSGQGSSQGTGQGSGQGSSQGTGQGSGQGGSQGTGQGSGQGGSQGTGQGSSQGTSTGTGSGATSLSQADAQLLTHVPTAIQSSCSAYQLQGADAAVECTTTDQSGNVVVIYGQFTSDSLDTAFAAQAQGLHFLSVGNCTSGQCTYGGDGAPNSGKVDYFSAQGDSGPLVGAVWTNTRTSILAIAAQNGTDVAPLLSWWESDAGPN